MSNWYRLKSSLFGILFALLSANLVWAQSEKDLENTGLEDSATIEQLKLFGDIPVSYTHLTLPTILLV